MDVDALLLTVGPKLFRRWQAWFRLRGYDEWERCGTIAAACRNAALIAAGITGDDLAALQRGPDYFIPPHWRIGAQQKRRQKRTVKEESAMLAAAYGPKV